MKPTTPIISGHECAESAWFLREPGPWQRDQHRWWWFLRSHRQSGGGCHFPVPGTTSAGKPARIPLNMRKYTKGLLAPSIDSRMTRISCSRVGVTNWALKSRKRALYNQLIPRIYCETKPRLCRDFYLLNKNSFTLQERHIFLRVVYSPYAGVFYSGIRLDVLVGTRCLANGDGS
jgi:hypothetical protein